MIHPINVPVHLLLPKYLSEQTFKHGEGQEELGKQGELGI